MQYRQFGRTGWQFSEIAFGAWKLDGDWGAVDDDASIRTLHHAFGRGINLVDTAYIYGDGHSEQVIGQALRQWSGHKIYLATKAQPVEWPAPNEEFPQMRGRYPAWYLRRMVDDALRRLQVEQIDLFQLHSWITAGLYELDWLETLNALRVEGKIDQIGVSIRDYRPADGVDLAQLGLVTSQQVVLNLFEQRPAGKLFRAGAGTQGFIARLPLDSGSLVGHWWGIGMKIPMRAFHKALFPHSYFVEIALPRLWRGFRRSRPFVRPIVQLSPKRRCAMFFLAPNCLASFQAC